MYLRIIFAFISGLFHLFFFFLSKYVPTTLESNLGEQFGEKKLSLSAHVNYTTAKQVVSLGGLDENGFEMYKNKKHTCKACKASGAVSSCQICKFVLLWLRQHSSSQSGEKGD